MKPSLSLASLHKRGVSIDALGASAAPTQQEDSIPIPSSLHDLSNSILPASTNKTDDNVVVLSSNGSPAGVLPLSSMNMSPGSGSDEPGTPPNVWGRLASSAPAGARVRRFLSWMGTALYPLWLPGYLKPEKGRMIDFEMVRGSEMPYHSSLEELGLWQVLYIVRYGRITSAFKELFRRARAEFWIELPLVRKKLLPLALCGGFQYVHAIFTQIAFYMHQPLPEPLHDTGFDVFPELGRHNQWVSETVFGLAFAAFVIWTLTPFITSKKRFFTVILYARWLMVLTACQILRIISFTATQLPAPNYHCRSAEFVSVKPQGIMDILIVNLKRQTTHGCGDLIFSSHTTFALSFILFYTQYGTYKFMKYFGWLYVAVLSCLIIASRKHYTVDIVIAWYTVPLVFFYMTKRWKIVRDPHARSSSVLPTTTAPPSSSSATNQGGNGAGSGSLQTSLSSGNLSSLVVVKENAAGGATVVVNATTNPGLPPSLSLSPSMSLGVQMTGMSNRGGTATASSLNLAGNGGENGGQDSDFSYSTGYNQSQSIMYMGEDLGYGVPLGSSFSAASPSMPSASGSFGKEKDTPNTSSGVSTRVGPLPPRPPTIRASSNSGVSSPRASVMSWSEAQIALRDPAQPSLPISTSPTTTGNQGGFGANSSNSASLPVSSLAGSFENAKEAIPLLSNQDKEKKASVSASNSAKGGLFTLPWNLD